jgi:hypothetical protein
VAAIRTSPRLVGSQKLRQFSPSLALVQIDIEAPLFTSLHLPLYRILPFERDPAMFHTPGLSARTDATFCIAGSVDIFIPLQFSWKKYLLIRRQKKDF